MRKLLIASLVAGLGCKGKPEHRPPPQNAPTTGSATATGSNAAGRPAPDIELPKGPGTPPNKTTAAITVEKMQELKKLSYTGFQPEMKQLDAKAGFEVVQRTEDHPKLSATISLQPCFDCLPMDAAKWKERTDALKVYVPEPLRNSKDLDFEVGQTELNGQPMIYTYQLSGLSMGSNSEGGGGFYTDAYVLYYNDGVNQARVVASYIDDPTDKAGLKKLAPKEDLENLAKAFMDVYTHAW